MMTNNCKRCGHVEDDHYLDEDGKNRCLSKSKRRLIPCGCDDFVPKI